MELRLDLTQEDINKFQTKYAVARNNPIPQCRPKLCERDWIAREILRELPSGATSQKGQWAVDATLKPYVETAVSKHFDDEPNQPASENCSSQAA